jgi:hypothetical protein
MHTAPGPHLGDARLLLPRTLRRSILQHRSTLFKAALLVLIAGAGFFLRWVFLSIAPPHRFTEECYNAITIGMSEDQIADLLGGAHGAPGNLDLPTTVAGLPEGKGWRQSHGPDSPVRWKWWKDEKNPDLWIAVAFLDEPGTRPTVPHVVAKRKSGF